MNTPFPIALDVRRKSRYWCIAAVLLAACSGGGSDTGAKAPQLASSVQAVTKSAAPTIADEDKIAELYWWILGRKPDDAGLQFWKQSGLSLESVSVELQKSQELVVQHGW